MNCTGVPTSLLYGSSSGLLLTEAKDDLTQTNQDTFTVYGYGANNAGTQQTKKTVHLGDDASDPVIEDNTYTYNLQGRMASAEVEKYDSSGQTLQEHTKYSYEYADDGIRVAQTRQVDVNNDGDFTDPEDTSERTEYLYDRNNPTGYAQILEEAINETLAKSYTLGLDVIAQQGPSIANGSNLFLLYDGHGSTRMLVDATGQPLANQVFRYDAFGNRLDSNTALTTLLYSGELTDATGLQYLRARYYDPGTVRFNRLDPFDGVTEDPQSLHKYSYCHANPISGIDPTGQFESLVGAMASFTFASTLMALDQADEGIRESASNVVVPVTLVTSSPAMKVPPGVGDLWKATFEVKGQEDGYLIQRVKTKWACYGLWGTFSGSSSIRNPMYSGSTPFQTNDPQKNKKPLEYWEVWFVHEGKIYVDPRDWDNGVAPIEKEQDIFGIAPPLFQLTRSEYYQEGELRWVPASKVALPVVLANAFREPAGPASNLWMSTRPMGGWDRGTLVACRSWGYTYVPGTPTPELKRVQRLREGDTGWTITDRFRLVGP